MKFFKKEWHQVASEFSYDIADDEIIKSFGSVKRFKEIISHLSKENFSQLEPQGEKPTEEEFNKFDEFIAEFGWLDRHDDWWTDRKGNYEMTFKYEGEEEDQKKTD